MVTAICQRYGPVDYGRAWRAVTAGAIPHTMVRNKIMVDPADAERLAVVLGLAREPGDTAALECAHNALQLADQSPPDGQAASSAPRKEQAGPGPPAPEPA